MNGKGFFLVRTGGSGKLMMNGKNTIMNQPVEGENRRANVWKVYDTRPIFWATRPIFWTTRPIFWATRPIFRALAQY